MRQSTHEAPIAPLPDSLAPISIGAPVVETAIFTGRETDERLNELLFGSTPPLDLPPAPTRERTAQTQTHHGHGLLPADGLIELVHARTQEKLGSAIAEGMPDAEVVLPAGQMWGQTRDDMLAAIKEYADTGVIPAPRSDVESYLIGCLVNQCAKTSVKPVLYLPREAAEHHDIRTRIRRAGFDPADVLATDHDMGGLFDDLRDLVVARQPFADLKAHTEAALKTLHAIESLTDADKLRRAELEGSLSGLTARMAPLDEQIDLRLMDEDMKIAVIVDFENTRSQGGRPVMPVMNGYTRQGTQIIINSCTNRTRNIDGLGEDMATDPSARGNTTAHAIVETARYHNGGKLPQGRVILLGGDGRIGADVARLLSLPESHTIKGRDSIKEFVGKPIEGVDILVSVNRGAKIIKAERFKHKLLSRILRRLGAIMPAPLVVDAGCGTDEHGVVHGNFDVDTLPADGSVRATKVRQITGALLMERAVDASEAEWRQNQTLKPSLEAVVAAETAEVHPGHRRYVHAQAPTVAHRPPRLAEATA